LVKIAVNSIGPRYTGLHKNSFEGSLKWVSK
jgi:hypothetical protein